MSQHERGKQSVPSLQIPIEREHDGDDTPGSPSPSIPNEVNEITKLRNAWQTAMKDVGVQGLPQKHCAVLLLSWGKELDDLDVTGEVDALETVFQERFHYTVKKKQILPGKSPEVQLQYFLADFLYEFDSPSTLLIVYYAGHGIPGKPGELKLVGSRKPKVKDEKIKRGDILWHQAEKVLKSAESSVLVIFDCCFAGNIADRVNTRGDHKRNFEFLGACLANGRTARPGPESFTTALIWALEKLVDSDKPFTTLELMTQINEKAPEFPQNQFPYLCERDEPCVNRLVLSPLRADMECAKSNAEESDRADECLDFRFFFKEMPDTEGITQMAEEIKILMRNQYISAHNAAWLGSPNFEKARHAAFIWRNLTVERNSKQTPRKSSTVQDIQINTLSPSSPKMNSQSVESLLHASSALSFSAGGLLAQLDGDTTAEIDIEGTITPSRGSKRPRTS